MIIHSKKHPGGLSSVLPFLCPLLLRAFINHLVKPEKPCQKKMKQITILFSLVSGFWVLVSEAKPPNIIFLMSDDQDTSSMGCYGNSEVKTPHLDALSAEGVTFDRHYTTTAICMGSRANVMMGMYEYKTGCNFDHGDMLQSTWKKSYPVLLREAGYLTAFAGKFGFEIKKQANDTKSIGMPENDFDRWGGGPKQTHYETAKNKSMENYAKDYPHSTVSYGAFGRDFIKDAAQQDKPFCLSISFKAPHHPTTPDPQFDHVYAGKTFTKPKNYGRENGKHFAEQSKQGRQYERFHAWHYSDKYDKVMATYYQQVYAIDVAVGMIRKALEKAGAVDNTVIIYTSDNGFLCGSHGYGSKVLPYEESSRVPLIIFDPRHENSGKKLRSKSLTGNIDFAPTILALAGLKAPENTDGKNLMNLYEDPTSSIHDSLALINVWGKKATHSLAVLTQDHKYIHWTYEGEGMEATEELYNLTKDPEELINLANQADSSEELKNLRTIYDKHLSHWQKEAVPYNNYQQYGTVFDRSVSWEEKKPLYIKTKWP